MKVIFLDIDGVLVTGRHLENLIASGDHPMDQYGHVFDPDAVLALNALVEKTGAKIVVSSSWRFYLPISRFREMWAARGMKGEIIDYVPTDLSRGEEIRQWLEIGPEVEKFVIIDDYSEFDEDQLPFFVQTTWKDGFTNHEFAKAKEILR